MMKISQRPYRGPIEIPELLKSYYEGKTVIEIGCGKGDYLPIWQKYAKKIIGYEGVQENFIQARTREDVSKDKVEIHEGWVNPENVAHGDFYYYWPESPLEVYSSLKKVGHKVIFATYAGVCREWVASNPDIPEGVSDFTSKEFLEWEPDQVIDFKASERDGRNFFDFYAKGTQAKLSICIKSL